MLAPRIKAHGRAFAHIAAFYPELTALRRDLHAHPEIGFEQQQLKRQFGVLFIVRGVELKFMRPARLDDLVDVSVALVQLGRAQVTLAQEVSCNHETLMRAKVNLACVTNGNFRPQPVPNEIVAAFANAAEPTTIKRNTE